MNFSDLLRERLQGRMRIGPAMSEQICGLIDSLYIFSSFGRLCSDKEGGPDLVHDYIMTGLVVRKLDPGEKFGLDAYEAV